MTFLTNHEEIKQWLDSVRIKLYTINPNGVVDVDGGVNLSNIGTFIETTIPVQFGSVADWFNVFDTNLTSLQGAPSSVGGSFNCDNTNITSLQYVPLNIGVGLTGGTTALSGLNCANTKISSLQGINKIIKQTNGPFICDENVTHILGLLLIKGITRVNIDRSGPIDKIMNKYIGTGDIISAQDELIDAGFREQAKL